MEQHEERERSMQWLTGVLASTVANWGFCRPEESLRPWDFALPLLNPPKPPRPKRINRQKIAADIRAQFDAYNKRFKERQQPQCPKS
jgi:hypothetical protein